METSQSAGSRIPVLQDEWNIRHVCNDTAWISPLENLMILLFLIWRPSLNILVSLFVHEIAESLTIPIKLLFFDLPKTKLDSHRAILVLEMQELSHLLNW